MSDFVPRDLLPDLWDEILRRHWTFLDTEESLQKLEERKKLEGCLKEFLCVVPHDRKFFLPETAHVLRKSVRELDDFTAHKAIVGFEAISQYANNLFTKPWRKEFRVLKTYSGFFQHEIKSNLLDADKLYEAMGYRRISDEVFVLDGPICPDQVTNVSRDAMAAYVECQIMKHIYAGLAAIGITCTMLDILHYRERHVGGTTQAIKQIAHAAQDKQMRKEKQLLTAAENTYGNIMPPNASQCDKCAAYHQITKTHYMPQPPPPIAVPCALHNTNPCALHASVAQTNLMFNGNSTNEANKLMASYPAANYQQHAFVAPGQSQSQHQQQQPPHMTHSRSLEHYNEPHVPLPHRHSFDHQQQGCMAHHHQLPPLAAPPHAHVYEAPYDCLDGISMGSSASYAAVAAPSGGGGAGYNNAYTHPYNAPGNRYPLPYTISNQLNTHYAAPAMGCNGQKNSSDTYPNAESNAYATISKPLAPCSYHAQQQQQQQQPQPPPVLPSLRQSVNSNNTPTPAMSNAAAMQYRQCSYPPDQLIDFDDRAPLMKHDFHTQMHASSSLDYERDQRRASIRANMSNAYAQPKDFIYTRDGPSAAALLPPAGLPPDGNDMYVYARPLPKSCRTNRQLSGAGPNNVTDKFIRNTELNQDCGDNNRKMQKELKEQQRSSLSNRRKLPTAATVGTIVNEHDTSDLTSYESASLDDFVTIGHGEHLLPSPTLVSKNQDGVGSFESWNYVFQNLERSGYSKDLGDREDLLVQSLDLNALTLSNGGVAGGSNDKRRTTHVETKSLRASNAALPSNERSRTLEKVAVGARSKREIKPDKIIKQTDKTPQQQQQQAAVNNNNNSSASTSAKKVKSALKTANIDNRNGHTSTGTGTSLNTRSRPASHTGAISKQPPPVSTQLIVTSPNEWSCRFCTFLNPDTKRICEMCCRSKDFNLESANVSHASTCV